MTGCLTRAGSYFADKAATERCADDRVLEVEFETRLIAIIIWKGERGLGENWEEILRGLKSFYCNLFRIS